MAATTKIWTNGLAPTCEDDDLNGFKNENNNLIVGSGQGISTADNQQTHKAVAHYSGVGDFFVDSGTGTAYVLSVTGVQVAPPTYATGMRIRFRAGNDNTGAATVNVAGLGVKALVQDVDGAALPADSIRANEEAQAYYDGVSFRLVSAARGTVGLAPSSGVWTPTFEGSAVAGTGWVYNFQVGKWHRMGNFMLLSFKIGITTKSGTATGDLVIEGVPFSADTDSGISGQLVGGNTLGVGITLSGSNGTLHVAYAGTAAPTLLIPRENWGLSNAPIALSQVANSTRIEGSILLPMDYP